MIESQFKQLQMHGGETEQVAKFARQVPIPMEMQVVYSNYKLQVEYVLLKE